MEVQKMSSAEALDLKAKRLARDYQRTEGELLEVLMQMRRTQSFLALGFSGAFDYVVRGLRLSEAQAYYFKKVAEKAEAVPELKLAIDQGVLTLSQARRIVTVVTPQNSAVWIEKAATVPQRQLEKAVAAENPNARITERVRPISEGLSELKVALTEEMEIDLKALKDTLMQKTKRPVSMSEVVAWAMRVCREKHDPNRKAQRAITSGKHATALSPKPGPIPARVKHEVRYREGGQCSFVGRAGVRCTATTFLDHHHKIPVARGGTNAVINLKLLCRAHHQFHHKTNP